MNKKSETSETEAAQAPTAFSQAVGTQAARKRKAQRHAGQGVWFGFCMMGLIGWSVVVPTLLGAAIGIWLDNRYAGNYSWTLMLLFIGLLVGCLNAWHWVIKEDAKIRAEQEEQSEQEKQNDLNE